MMQVLNIPTGAEAWSSGVSTVRGHGRVAKAGKDQKLRRAGNRMPLHHDSERTGKRRSILHGLAGGLGLDGLTNERRDVDARCAKRAAEVIVCAARVRDASSKYLCYHGSASTCQKPGKTHRRNNTRPH